nr:uncharacterized protein LOC104092576 [Nicotiana tomentosiformis]
MSFMEGEKVLLRVSPMKGIKRFGRKSKLSTRYIGSFEVLERVGKVAYRIAWPPSLAGVHPVSVQLDENLDYEERPVAILDRQVGGFVSGRFEMDLGHLVSFLEAQDARVDQS